MTAHPIWFGDGEGALSGWLHLPPDGKARGGAVLCPTLGLEALTAYSAYRQIAEDLAAAGVAVLRFDYRGSGDSVGPMDLASVEGWIEDVERARAHLGSCGVSRIALVGLRLGATLAAAAAARHRPEALVLWDPISRGRAFVREQQALKGFAIGDAPAWEAGVELAALVLPEALAGDLSRLSLRSLHLGGASCLLLDREGHDEDPLVGSYLEGAAVERRPVAGQEAFIDVEPGSAVLPGATMATIVSWLDRHFAGRPSEPVRVVGAHEVALPSRPGLPVVERALVYGAHGAFGILTEPVGGGQGPAIVLSSLGALPHVGPGRLWVELARSFAAEGRRVLRFDVGGIGDSPTHPGRTPRIAYPADGVADMLEAAALASPADPRNVVLVGICSGAYHAVETARVLRPAGLAAINPVFNLIPPELRDPAALESESSAPPPPNRLLSWMRHQDSIVRVAKLRRLDAVRRDPRLARRLDARLPEGVWRLLMRAGLVAAPASGLAGLTEEGTDVLLVCGRFESRPYRRCRSMVDDLASTGRFRLEMAEWIDHSLFGAAAAAYVRELVAGHLAARFPVCRPAPIRRLGGRSAPVPRERVAVGAGEAGGLPEAGEPTADPPAVRALVGKPWR